MSSPLSLDDHRCPGCGRVARVVNEYRDASPGEALAVRWHDPEDGSVGWSLHCCCGWEWNDIDERPTLRHLLTSDGDLPVGPGLGRLLVEALERRSVVAGPSRDEIRATLRRLPADELLEWAVIGASPPVPNCGHRGPDGCCNYPDHVSAECHAGAPCPLVAIASAPRPSWRWAIPVGPGLYRDAFGRLTQGVWVSADGTATDDEPAYTSDPPPPSPGGVTWYRHCEERSPVDEEPYAYAAVRGDRYTVHDPSDGPWVDWDDLGPISEWDSADERRSVASVQAPEWVANPVPRPEWAEGEGE